MRRVIVLSLSILFICTAAMAASDSELARQYMAEHPLPLPLPAPISAPAPSAKQAAMDGDVARVKTFSGTAMIARSEKVIPVTRDEKIYQGDTLKTGADGSVGITFRDNTTLSLGPNSVVVIQEFLFAPAQGKLSIVTRLIKGTAAYLSGVIAKLSPQSVRFETPVATVGFRGTKLLVKIDEGESK
jgi:hypothetical protein